ncbi:LysR family transcriptional regulator [Coralliovum pocilloporae]|uniref:LysR family transcriptional regulator n=1 Tax=Coralliovum pocilloporae TaxID=3066369 RepID=UPI0033072934
MSDHMPPLNWLRAFEAAARNLSFTTAAEELHITQSAISQQIKSLEAHLGQALFIRRPRGLQLTDTGRAYLPNVEAAFRLIADGTQRIFSGNDSDRYVEIHVNLAFSIYWLTPRIHRFIKEHPWVVLNVSTSVWTTEFTRPYASVEIRFGSGEWEGISGQRLGEQRYFPLCAPSLLPQLQTPSDMLDHDLFDLSGMLEGWDNWLKAAGSGLPKSKPIHRASTFTVTFEIVRRGLGLTLGHSLIADDLIAQGALARPFDLTLPLREGYYLISPPERSMNSAALAFKSWLEKELGDMADVN